jgi:hypothetical protein
MSSYFTDPGPGNGTHTHQLPLLHNLPPHGNPPLIHRSLAPLLNNMNVNNSNDFPPFYHSNQPVDEDDEEEEEDEEDADVDDDEQEEELENSSVMDESVEKDRKVAFPPSTTPFPLPLPLPLTVNPKPLLETVNTKKDVEMEPPSKKLLHGLYPSCCHRFYFNISFLHSAEAKTTDHAHAADGALADSMELLKENRVLRKKVTPSTLQDSRLTDIITLYLSG